MTILRACVYGEETELPGEVEHEESPVIPLTQNSPTPRFLRCRLMVFGQFCKISYYY